jgi:hypothetical protein
VRSGVPLDSFYERNSKKYGRILAGVENKIRNQWAVASYMLARRTAFGSSLAGTITC